MSNPSLEKGIEKTATDSNRDTHQSYQEKLLPMKKNFPKK
jgi:hypothetical protein